MTDFPDRLILVSIGNTHARIALALDAQLEPSQVLPSSDAAEIAQHVASLAAPGADSDSLADASESRVLIATVNPPAADALVARLAKVPPFSADPDLILRFGPDLPVPVADSLLDNSTVGQDRLLDALGAFARSKQACIVVDAGTAITVDFIDGHGCFHGGAIAPGLNLMARSLHDHTAALPLINIHAELDRIAARPAAPLKEEIEDASPASLSNPFGKRTSEAIALGVVAAARGLVRQLVEKYAEFYNAYPRVVATGGDAPLLFQNDDLVEAIVPDLTLVGMLEAVKLLRAAESGAEN